MLTIVAIVILVVVAAIAIYYVQSRKQKYILNPAGSSPNEYGTYLTDATESLGGGPSNKEDLATSIQMETKTEVLPSSSLVATNPVALELEADIKEKETLMTTGDGEGGGGEGGEGEKSEGEKGEGEKPIDEANKDTHP